jgi:hypothetical protein
VLHIRALALYLVAVPAIGCTLATSAPDYPPVPPRQRLVGIAYSTWHMSRDWKGVWGTPELGFYTSDDRAVIRKHGEWLAAAGVDFIWIDWSNDVGRIST